MAAAGIMNLSAASGDALASNRVSSMAASGTGTTGAASSQSSASGITANDFLTLLVTEMKNQDPTANTDPNEYINQLVNVNSLQQLISINETLTGAFGSSDISADAQTAHRSTTEASAQADSAATTAGNDSAQSSLVASNATTVIDGRQTYAALLNRLTHGNLSVPNANPAAERLAHSNEVGVASRDHNE